MRIIIIIINKKLASSCWSLVWVKIKNTTQCLLFSLLFLWKLELTLPDKLVDSGDSPDSCAFCNFWFVIAIRTTKNTSISSGNWLPHNLWLQLLCVQIGSSWFSAFWVSSSTLSSVRSFSLGIRSASAAPVSSAFSPREFLAISVLVFWFWKLGFLFVSQVVL